MRAYLAIHEAGPTLYLPEYSVAEVEAVLQRPRHTVSWAALVGRDWFKLWPSDEGPSLMDSSVHDPAPHRIMLTADYVVRCSPYVVTFSWRDGALQTTLPNPWELPWPFYHSGPEGTFDKHAAAVREISRRMDLKGKATGDRSLSVPGHVQDLLEKPERVRLFSEWRI